jgi:HEAT repeat protein
MGPKASGAVPALTEALCSDSDPAVRKQAAIAIYAILARNGGDEANRNAVSALKDAQKDRDPAVRAAAAVGLSVLRADPALTGPALLRAVRDGDAWGRAQAVSELAYGLPKEWARRVDVHDTIIVALGDADAYVRESAMNSFLVVSERDPSIFDTALKCKDVRLRRGAVEALLRNSLSAGAAYPVLVSALNDADAAVRDAAARALSGAIPRPDANVTPALVEALKDRNAEVRKAAVLGLGKFGTRAKEALPAIYNSLHDDDPGVRRAAVHVVRSIEGELREDETTFLLWSAMLKAGEPATRAQGAEALRRMGPAAMKALPTLLRLIADDPNAEVRESAARARDAISRTD